MARCAPCATDVQPTTYGRCPMCGAVVDAGTATARDRARAWDRPSQRADDAPAPTSACGVGCGLLLGMPALLACLGLIHVGNRNRWSSDGPGMLFVMLAVLVTGGVAFLGLGTALASAFPPLGRLINWLDE